MNYVQVRNGKIVQTAIGFEEPPFDNAIEVSWEIANNPNDYVFENGRFLYSPQPDPPEPEPEPEEQEPNMEEILLAALLEIQDLKNKIAELEGELNA